MNAPSSPLTRIGVILLPNVACTFILLTYKVIQSDNPNTITAYTHLENIINYILAEFSVD